MSRAVLISIRPKWCELIASGQKTVEVRKTKPKIETPFKVYIYHALPKWGDWNERDGRVIGEFVCEKIDKIRVFENGTVQFWMLNNLHDSCLEYDELADYIGWGKHGYGWHISGLVIYDKPKKLSEFNGICAKKVLTDCDCGSCKRLLENGNGHCPLDWIKHAPQSWRYVEEL